MGWSPCRSGLARSGARARHFSKGAGPAATAIVKEDSVRPGG
ncbi:hypothetical protein T261_5105 [Streptomyces lydicus]|nr:hypothetical protein T261_5105 [Streptomyces lydicus]